MRFTGRICIAAAVCVGAMHAGCGSPARQSEVMTYAELRVAQRFVPCVLQARHNSAKLVYYGARFFYQADDPQVAEIERWWAQLRPDYALYEGVDVPLEATRELAIGRHGEAGLIQWLANRDGVLARSLDPTIEQQVAAMRSRFSVEELKLFYILREVVNDAKRAPEFRESMPEVTVAETLDSLANVPGLEGAPRTLSEFEAAFRRRSPQVADWREVPHDWFHPWMDPQHSFANTIMETLRQFRDEAVVDALEAALRDHKRVFAVIGASHVIMQEPELRRRFEVVAEPWAMPSQALPASSEMVSLLGVRLTPPALPEARREELARKLTEYSERAASPDAKEEDFVWLGRTLAYLHRYHDAIGAFTRGIEKFPNSYRLLRHRGHRFITIRRLDLAWDDLARAASLIEDLRIQDEVEPDGVPNRFGVPRSTTNTNIYYHLGLVCYLDSDFDRAAEVFRKCLAISPNDDMTVATVHWLYMSLRRAGHDAAAKESLASIRPDMHIFENDAYFRLCRMYQGAMTPEQVLPTDPNDMIGIASTGYGVANWHWCEGRRDEARALLEKVAASPMWPAFGVIAAEADLLRLRQNP